MHKEGGVARALCDAWNTSEGVHLAYLGPRYFSPPPYRIRNDVYQPKSNILGHGTGPSPKLEYSFFFFRRAIRKTS